MSKQQQYRSPTVEALYDKYGYSKPCAPEPQPQDVPFIPKGAGPRLFSMALVAFAILFSIGTSIGVVIANSDSGNVHASPGYGGGGSEGVSVIVLVFSVIAAFALGGLLTSIFLGGGFRFKRKVEEAQSDV